MANSMDLSIKCLKNNRNNNIKHLLKKGFITLPSIIIFSLPNQLSADSLNFTEPNKRSSYRTQTEFNNFRTNEVFFSMFADKESSIDMEEKGIVNTLIESFTKKLLENKNLLMYNDEYGDAADLTGVVNAHFEIYNNKIEDIPSIKRDIMTRSLVNSIRDTFNQTSIGKKIKHLGENIARYFIIEYSKTGSEDKARFYALGKLSVERMKRKKEYTISLSASLYSKPNSLKEDFSLGLRGNYHDTKMNVFYNIPKEGFGLNLRTGKIESLFGTELNFYSKYYEDERSAGLAISVDF
jgi:hypothetical protein